MAISLPKVEIYTRDKTSPRSFRWQWFLRLTAILFTLIILGLSGAGASEFSSSGCSAPSKLNYNLAVVRSPFHAIHSLHPLTYLPRCAVHPLLPRPHLLHPRHGPHPTNPPPPLAHLRPTSPRPPPLHPLGRRRSQLPLQLQRPLQRLLGLFGSLLRRLTLLLLRRVHQKARRLFARADGIVGREGAEESYPSRWEQ